MVDDISNEETEASINRFSEMLSNLALSDFAISPEFANECIKRIKNGEDIESIIGTIKQQLTKPN